MLPLIENSSTVWLSVLSKYGVRSTVVGSLVKLRILLDNERSCSSVLRLRASTSRTVPLDDTPNILVAVPVKAPEPYECKRNCPEVSNSATDVLSVLICKGWAEVVPIIPIVLTDCILVWTPFLLSSTWIIGALASFKKKFPVFVNVAVPSWLFISKPNPDKLISRAAVNVWSSVPRWLSSILNAECPSIWSVFTLSSGLVFV